MQTIASNAFSFIQRQIFGPDRSTAALASINQQRSLLLSPRFPGLSRYLRPGILFFLSLPATVTLLRRDLCRRVDHGLEVAYIYRQIGRNTLPRQRSFQLVSCSDDGSLSPAGNSAGNVRQYMETPASYSAPPAQPLDVLPRENFVF